MSPQFPTIVLRAQSDEKLARLAASGNERAFEAIVDRYRQPLLRYATRIIGDSRADDVVQAAFLSAWTKLHDGEDVRELKAWLYRIVHNGALNAIKRASSRDVPLLVDSPMASYDDSQAEVEQREAMRDVLGGIAALPEQQRQAFLAVAVDGRRHRDVGDELGVSEGAVRMLIHRARTSVRAAAAALSPIPLISSLLKGGAGAGAATTGGTGLAAAGGSAGGAGLLAGGALKAGALVAATGLVATAGPPTVSKIKSEISGAPKAAKVVPAAAGPSKASTPSAPKVTVEKLKRASKPAAANKAPAPKPGPAAKPAPAPAPAPVQTVAAAPAPAPAPVTPKAVVEKEFDVTLPGSRPKPRALFEVADAEDDDMILVEEDPPNYAIGERDIPLTGLPDDSGVTVNLPDEAPDDDGDDTPPAFGVTPVPSAPATR